MKWIHETSEASITLMGSAARHGVTALFPRGSQLNLVREPYFSLNVYRFMDKGRLMAISRDEPFETERTPNGMILRWQATAAHPAELVAEYHVVGPGTVDVHLTSTTNEALSAYEVYLSSYFDFSMDPYIVAPSLPGKKEKADQRLLKLTDNPLIHGHYLVFPADSRGAALRFDGRWIDPATGRSIAPWVSGPFLAYPITLMANEEFTVVQMVDPDSWLGIGTTYSGDPDDNIVRHNALYISLFGNDTEAGTQQSARIRQVFRKGLPTVEELLEMYDEFVGA